MKKIQTFAMIALTIMTSLIEPAAAKTSLLNKIVNKVTTPSTTPPVVAPVTPPPVTPPVVTPPVVTPPVVTQGKTYQGIYCVGYVQMQPKAMSMASPLWQASYLSGFALRAAWSAVQPSKGAYNWSMFDQGLALAKQNNKKISLSITPGALSPSWLINEGASYINIVATAAQPNVRSKIVLPWDATFQREWAALIAAEGARYDNDPNVGYVTIGGAGTYVETFMVQNQQDYNTFVAAGGLPKWIQGTEAVIDMYGAAFKNTPFILALGCPVLNVPSGDDAGQAALQTVINYGLAKYPGRFGVGSHGLSASSLDTTKYNYFISQIIMANSATSPTGFQMIDPATGATASMWNVGNLGTAVANGMQMGGQFIEVYQTDCQNPVYTAMLESANSQLNGN